MRPKLSSLVFAGSEMRPLLTIDRRSYPRQVRLINSKEEVQLISPHLLERQALKMGKSSAYKLESFLDPEVFIAFAGERKVFMDPEAIKTLEEDWKYVNASLIPRE